MAADLIKIDTSYWRRDNPEWVASREKYWPVIEFMIQAYKPKKKNRNPIKDFYFRGKMPNWKAYKYWDDASRHLDLFMMLWLHPSWDNKVLTELRNSYMASDQVTLSDIRVGFGNFLDSQINIPACPYRHMREVRFPYIEGKGELLFDVMMGDRNITEYELASETLLGRKQIYTMPKERLQTVATMGAWLAIEDLLPVGEGFLFQYDEPLNWWYESVKESDFFVSPSDYDLRGLPSIEKGFWRIHNFDTVKEGDTCRSRFAHKIRKILDEREFVEEIKTIWSRVKAGDIHPEDPWKR
ncbi:hypothetical protein [Microbulbifer sp. TRSA007]|uniref:hypothetical protein n=1 Tax=Microbulbifer sp. TRSA007 TaxID=3243384 RepID=UPI0040398018